MALVWVLGWVIVLVGIIVMFGVMVIVGVETGYDCGYGSDHDYVSCWYAYDYDDSSHNHVSGCDLLLVVGLTPLFHTLHLKH